MDSGVWDYSVPDAGRIAFACDRILDPTGKPVPLACPRYVQVIDRPIGRFMLICDNYGVYEVGPVGAGIPPVTRSFRDADYRAMLRDMKDFDTGGDAGAYPLRMPLVASSVQELMNGDWLITNSYSGTVGVDFGPPVGIVPKTFSGEAFEISWNSDGTVKKVEWSSPYVYVLTMPDPNDPTKKISQWDTWKQRLENSYILQQPRSAVRQM
jgi:hypothetical protein